MAAAELVSRETARLVRGLRNRLHPYVAWGVAHVYRTPLDRQPAAPQSRFRAREVGREELAALAHAFERPARSFELRVEKGDRCVCSFDGARPVHMRWFATTPTFIPELGAYACPGRGEAYVYDSHTDPAYRRQGAMAVERALMIRLLIDSGVRCTFNYVLADNRASRATLLTQARLVLAIPFVRFGDAAPVIGAPLAHPLYKVGAELHRPSAIPGEPVEPESLSG